MRSVSSKMNPFGGNKPVVLKTYGKYSKKVEPWLSPDIRKIAFASTSSSDLSIGEPVQLRKRKKVSSTAARPGRAAKERALKGLCEIDSDNESVFDSTPERSRGTSQKRSGDCVLLPAELGRFVTDRRRGMSKMPRRQSSHKRKRVSVCSGSLNSSAEFVKSLPRRPPRPTQRRVTRLMQKQNLSSGNSSSELGSPVPNLSRARIILKAMSLNGTTNKPSERSYKKPFLSSTPSISSRPSYRHQEPSISEISCSLDNIDEVLKSSMEATRGSVSSGKRVLKVLLERNAEVQRYVRDSLPERENDRLLSVEKEYGGIPQYSQELFSLVQCESEVKSRAGMLGNGSSLENVSVPFVSAETNLDLPVASLKERGTAVVVLEKTDLSKYLDDKNDKEKEDTYSSCVDSESPRNVSGSEDRLASCVEMPQGTECCMSDRSGKSQDGNGWQMHVNDELHSGFRLDENASIALLSTSDPPGSLGRSSDGHRKEKACCSFGTSGALSPLSNSVFVGEQSKDLALERCEIELEDRSREAAHPSASCQEVSFFTEQAAVDFPFSPVMSAEAQLRKSCISTRPVVVLEVLEMPKSVQGCGIPLESGSNSPSENDFKAQSLESSREILPVSYDSPAQLKTLSQGRRRTGDMGKNDRRPKECPRKRLSAMSAFVPDMAKTANASSGCVSSPGKKRGPGRVRNQGGPPKDKPGTGRRACVSGLSAKRWAKNDRQRTKKQRAHSQLSRAGDCSLVDFQRVPETKKQHDTGSGLLQGTSIVFPGTPLRLEPLNISSLLVNFTPDTLTTQTWSRLKAALSVHKKKKAFTTPKKLKLSHPELRADGSLDGNAHLLSPPVCTPVSRLLKTSLLRSAVVTPVSPSLFLEDITDAEKLYHECQQEAPVSFEHCIPPCRMKLCKKVGEGTFGEVFTTVNDSNQTVALKIVPIEGKQKVNGEDQKTFGEVLHEVIISKELSCLDAKEINRTNGFIGLIDLHCVRGCYPDLLLSAWDKFHKQRRSENDRPDFFTEDQLFLILEFEFGGSDLEAMNGKLSSLAAAKSILHQVTASLAVAEQALCFEHRDLHWGNILVKSTKEKTGTYVLNGTSHTFETKGVHVNIIDYSLSRLEIDGLTVSCDISADEELFMGKGDYQFDIYRKMREENGNSWSEYNPHTNVLWIHYLADKLLKMTYKSKPKSKPMTDLRRNIKSFHSEVPDYKSAASVLEGSSLFREA